MLRCVYCPHTIPLYTHTHAACYILYILRKSQFSRSPPGKNKRDIFTRQTLNTIHALFSFWSRARHTHMQRGRERARMCAYLCSVHCNEIECTLPSTFAHVVKSPILPADGNTTTSRLDRFVYDNYYYALCRFLRLTETFFLLFFFLFNFVCLNVLRHGIYRT